MTDAMGHGVAAALTATLCVSALRGSRRQGASLLEQAAAANAALAAHAALGAEATADGSAASGGSSGQRTLEDFVTGVLGRVDLRAGTLELVNAGHVPPYLLRGEALTTVDLPTDVPFGLFRETTYHSSALALRPGDRFVLVTDGMLERNAAEVDFPATIRETRSLHPREAVRELADTVLRATERDLRDDATVLLLDWHGGHDRERDAVAGAESGRASTPLR
jgi:serine phosphatase RsbU (regulator of sigma subunit)